MSEWVWVNGHLSWVLFGIIAYSLACLLVVDYVWRLVRMRGAGLLSAAAIGWTIGVLVICAAFYVR